MLLLIATTFSHCLLVTGSCKDTIISLYSFKKLDFKTLGFTEFITRQALSNSLALLGQNSPGPLVYKFFRSLCFEVYYVNNGVKSQGRRL